MENSIVTAACERRKDHKMRISLLAGLTLLISSAAICQETPKPVRAVLAGVVNTSKDLHTIMLRTTADALRMELVKNGTYDIIPWAELEHVAKMLKIGTPTTEDEYIAIAKKADAQVVIVGEIKSVDIRTHDKAPEVGVSLIVRVRDAMTDELVNGAAERGVARDVLGGSKAEAIMIVDAAESAAVRCVYRMSAYRPIEGTILSSPGNGPIVLNRGLGHAVKSKQEFVVFRGGIKVGRLQVGKVFPQYSELSIVENVAPIQPRHPDAS